MYLFDATCLFGVADDSAHIHTHAHTHLAVKHTHIDKNQPLGFRAISRTFENKTTLEFSFVIG